MNDYSKQWGKLEREVILAAEQAERAARAMRGLLDDIRRGESFEDCWWHPEQQNEAYAGMVARVKSRHERLL